MVVGLPDEAIAERLDREEPGWKISGKYVGWILSLRVGSLMDDVFFSGRRWYCSLKVVPGKQSDLRDSIVLIPPTSIYPSSHPYAPAPESRRPNK